MLKVIDNLLWNPQKCIWVVAESSKLSMQLLHMPMNQSRGLAERGQEEEEENEQH